MSELPFFFVQGEEFLKDGEVLMFEHVLAEKVVEYVM